MSRLDSSSSARPRVPLSDPRGVGLGPTPLPLFMEVAMLDFFSGCVSLFSKTFNTACGMEYFRFLAAFLLFQVCLGLFLLIFHGSRKL